MKMSDNEDSKIYRRAKCRLLLINHKLDNKSFQRRIERKSDR